MLREPVVDGSNRDTGIAPALELGGSEDALVALPEPAAVDEDQQRRRAAGASRLSLPEVEHVALVRAVRHVGMRRRWERRRVGPSGGGWSGRGRRVNAHHVRGYGIAASLSRPKLAMGYVT